MVTMNILRMLVDISFFFAFTGFIALHFGSVGVFPVAVLQALCFGLSCIGGKKRILRLAFLLPMALGWYICRGSLTDCILIAPTAAYILWLVWKSDYALDRERQVRLFTIFWKILVIFLPFMILLGGLEKLTATTLPYAIVMLTASVLLMRSLRHEPKVYCQRRYQLMNLATVLIVLIIALFLGSEFFLSTCVAAIKAFYNSIVLPILMVLLWAFMFLIQGVIWLASFFELKLPTSDEPVEIDDSGVSDILNEIEPANVPNELLRSLAIAVLVIAAVVVLILFFRWMNKRSASRTPSFATEEDRADLPVRQAAAERDSSPVRSVRAQYRKFLKLCASLGIRPRESDTSRDVDDWARQQEALSKVSGPIRDIYIQARYAGRADQDGVRQIKKLCAEGKKNLKS